MSLTWLISRYVKTPILSKDIQDYLDGKGVSCALVEDCARAMLYIASDSSINGGSTFCRFKKRHKEFISLDQENAALNIV